MNYILIIFIEKYDTDYSRKKCSMLSIKNTIEIVQKPVQSLVDNILDVTVQGIVHRKENKI